MKKIFYLFTCSTCNKILSSFNDTKDFELREIKSEAITESEIDAMKALSGSYESLFSRRAMKYKSMGLKDKNLSEEDYKKLILEEYTFLKRPVVLAENEIFIGNSKKVVEAMQSFFAE